MTSSARIGITTGLVSLVAFAAAAPSASADGAPAPQTIAPKTCGEGVCKRNVTGTLACTPGQRITANDGWLSKPDPTTGSWDANCDGTANTTDDEFVEIVNTGTIAVDLSGATLSDGGENPAEIETEALPRRPHARVDGRCWVVRKG